MSRQGENIRKRIDGRWEGRYRTVIAGGEIKYRSVYGKTYSEVKEKMFEAAYTANHGLQDHFHKAAGSCTSQNDIDFCSVTEAWLKEVEQNRKYSTYIKYKTLYRCHIQTLFPDSKLNQITNDYIQKQLAALEVSDATRRSILAVIKQVLRYGEEQYGYAAVSVANKFPRNKPHSIEVMNRKEQVELIRFLQKDMNISKAGILLCLFTGLRLGEICSLKWADIDRERMLLHVCRTVQRIESKDGPTKTVLLETSPKSFFSNREIPLPDTLLKLLVTFQKAGQEYVLCTNKPMEPRTYQNHFKRYLQNINVPNYHFHTLRHTFATNCIDSGMDVKSLSEILGHSDVQITLNRYVHPSMDTKRRYMDALSADYGQLDGQL